MNISRRIRKAGFYVLATPVGNAFVNITKPFFNNKSSKIGNIWWYGFLYNYASNLNIEKVKKNNKGFRVVKTIMPDFDYFHSYNTVFHLGCISHIIYELSQGYIPIIEDRERVWDQFFELPVQIDDMPDDTSDLPISDELSTLYTPALIPYCKPVRLLWSELIKKFSRLKPKEKQYIQDEIDSIIGDQKVLGIVCRGTDYIGTGMPKQPKIEDVISEAEKWMKEYNYEKIYLATEAESIYEAFSKAFPGKILVNKRQYYDKAMLDQNVKWINLVHFERENDNYLKGLEYLSSIYILAHCDALLAGYCGASNMALLLNDDKYDRFKIYDLG